MSRPRRNREHDLFANFERMRREIDEIFGNVWDRAGLVRRHAAGFAPPVDVYYCESPAEVVVRVELAGVDAQDVALDVHGRDLIISGRRKPRAREGRIYQQIEIEHGPFLRRVGLGVDVCAASTDARYEDGVLTVKLPIVAGETGVRHVEVRGRGAQGG